MGDEARRELRDMLLGRGRYARKGAPEPGLLPELMEYLPEWLLGEVLQIASQQWDTSLRMEMLRALLSRLARTDIGLEAGLLLYVPEPWLSPLLEAALHRLSEDERHATLDRVVSLLREDVPAAEEYALAALGPYLTQEQLATLLDDLTSDESLLEPVRALAALAPYLSSSLVRRALDLAMALEYPAWRAEWVVVLLPHARAVLQEERAAGVPPEQGTLSQALKAVGEMAEPWDQVQMLQELAPYLPPELAGPALDIALALEWEGNRADALVALAGYLPEQELSRALDTVERISDEAARVSALVGLMPHLSPGQVDRALALVRRVQGEYLSVQALKAAAPRLTPDQLARALEWVRRYRDEAHRVAGYEALLPHLPATLREETLDRLLAMANRSRRGDVRADALAQLAPFLSPETFAQALEAAQGIRQGASRLKALAALAPYAAQEQWPALLQAAALTEPARFRAELLAVLAPYLPGSLMEPALELANKLEEAEGREGVLAALAARFAVLGNAEAALDLTVGLRGHGPLSVALAALAPHLSEPLADRALELARAISDPMRRVAALAYMAARGQASLRSAALEDVLGAAREVRGEWDRAEVLYGLAQLIPDANWRRLAYEVTHRAESVLDRIPLYHLRDLLDEIPSERRESLLRRTLGAMRERYEGGQTDAAPIPDDFVADDVRDLFAVASAGPRELEMVEPARERIVSTGFAAPEEPADPLPTSRPLAPASCYCFWLEVGAPVAGSMEVRPTALPTEHLPDQARLRVVLFGFPGGLEIAPDADMGELQLRPDGTVVVAVQPGGRGPDSLDANDPLLLRRLFFPVRTPAQEGACRMRCSIYYEQALVQSRLIEVQVRRADPDASSIPGALRSEVDYTLSHSLNPTNLAPLQQNRLSLMLNDNGDGTHSFRFLGADDTRFVKGDVVLDAHEVQDLIKEARGAMRRAAWGTEMSWEQQPYRYHGPPDLDRLRNDLIRFAVRGYRFYDQVIDRLGGDYAGGQALTELMRTSGQVQIALKRTPRFVLPASMIYDSRLKTNTPWDQFALCPEFLAAMQRPEPLEQCRCFQGDCPSRDQRTIVCPSGFWGYRHALGMPLSVGEGDDLNPAILYRDAPVMDVSVSTDPAFTVRPLHEQRLRSLYAPLTWRYANTYEQTFDNLLDEPQPHVVYFYCHGGVAGTTPFIKVGPLNSMAITRDDLRSEGIRWATSRALVFINGCHTTALEPEVAFNFVSAFVEVAAASGVIGTEITVFEPLAAAFAEEMFRHFLVGVPVGEAVRRARLELLKQGNPLGLVYIPFAMAGLRLMREAAPTNPGEV